MTTHAPTPEQQLIIDAAVNTSDNLIVSALAGAAKTTTLVMVAQALHTQQILCLAFNKKIATEMTERLPSNCQAMTLNSLGHRTWAEAIGRKVILEKDKNFKILTNLIKDLPKSEQTLAYGEFADTLKAIESGKSAGYIPTGHFPNAKRLMDDDEFFSWLEDEPSALQEKLIRDVTLESIAQGLKGTIDFSDQILLPTVFPSMFPSFPVVLIDEAQDLSALNHATLRKLAKKRLIAVGDSNQAIYGFRGAHEDSMSKMKTEFNMKELTLSVSFRCPISVVEAARWRAPHMQWPSWAKDGTVETKDRWSQADVPQTAAIICRNNAPLFSMAIKLLKNKRYPQIIGNDLGKYLIKILKKFGKSSIPQEEVLIQIALWVEEKLKKSRTPQKVHDQADCLRIFAMEGETLGDATAYAEHLFNSQGPILLMTGHKAKGLEFDTVFFLDEHLIDIEQGQEKNLRYVIQTRSKNELYYVNSDDFVNEMEEAA